MTEEARAAAEHLIVCTRQFQNSIADSVYRVVRSLGLERWFEMMRQSIYCTRTGSEFIFKGFVAPAVDKTPS
jgi:hypothetical protein